MNFRNFFESDEWWNDIVKTVRGGAYQKSPSQDEIYSALTRRDSRNKLNQQYQDLNLKEKEEKYDAMLQNLEQRLKSKGFNVTNDWYWFHIEIPFQQKYAANYNKVPVDAYKTYRTFVPAYDNKVTTFLVSLPGFAQSLKQLQDADPNYPDRIQFKLPKNLQVLYDHPDSLVVHFRNRYNRDRINKLIDEYFTSKGVKFAQRQWRATQGYDMLGDSHSGLISLALQKLIKKHESQLRQISEPQVKEWLEKWINYFNNLSPDDMHDYLNANK